jgi:hypothetical protein
MGGTLAFIGVASAPGSGPIKALGVVTSLVILVAFCVAFYISILLFRVASSVQVLRYRQTNAEVQAVFQTYSKFWTALGIFVMSMLIALFLLTFMFLALGVSVSSILQRDP